MSTIFVNRINESTLRITSDDFGIEKEIDDYFKYRPNGYQFSPKFKQRIWDGFVRLYSIHKKHLPYGLLPYLQKFAESNNYVIKILDELYQHTQYPEQEILDYINSLKLTAGSKSIQLRDYQSAAVIKLINYGRGVAAVPTGGGKSAIIYAYIRWMLDRGERVILIVPTVGLVNQMYSDFKEYSSDNEWNVESNCSLLFSGQPKEITTPVLISTWQSIHSLDKIKTKETRQFFEQWTVAIGDEAHQFKADAILGVMNKMINAKYRLGTTGTVNDEKLAKLNIEGAFGPIFQMITTKELIDRKELSDLKIKCIILSYPAEIRSLMKKAEYDKELDYIVTNETRHRFIVNLAKVCTGNTLVLFQFVEKHGKKMYELAKELIKDKNIYYISGEVNPTERERIRLEFTASKNAILFANKQTTATGINIPSIENIIFSSPSKSKITNLQSIGRGLRLANDKNKCNLFDIADDISYKNKINYTLSHLRDRMEIYSAEQFDFSVSTIGFKP